MYYMLSPDILAKGADTSPDGFALTQLIADWDSIGGNLPIPAPPPPPPVPQPPAPPGSITLLQAQEAAVAALQALRPLIPRSTAKKAVSSALAKLTGWST
jgi:hypothetical protein